MPPVANQNYHAVLGRIADALEELVKLSKPRRPDHLDRVLPAYFEDKPLPVPTYQVVQPIRVGADAGFLDRAFPPAPVVDSPQPVV